MQKETLIVIVYIFSYLTIGIAVSFYMIHYYMEKLRRPIYVYHLLLATVGSFVWPLQIIKHIVDRWGQRKEEI